MLSSVQTLSHGTSGTQENCTQTLSGHFNGQNITALPSLPPSHISVAGAQWQHINDDAALNTPSLARTSLSVCEVDANNIDEQIDNWMASIPNAKGESLVDRYFVLVELFCLEPNCLQACHKFYDDLANLDETVLKVLLNKVKTPPKVMTYGGEIAYKDFVETLDSIKQDNAISRFVADLSDFSFEQMNREYQQIALAGHENKSREKTKALPEDDMIKRLKKALLEQSLPFLDKVQVTAMKGEDQTGFAAVLNQAHSQREALEVQFNESLSQCFKHSISKELSPLWMDFQHIYCLSGEESDEKALHLVRRLESVLKPLTPSASLALVKQIRALDTLSFSDTQKAAFNAIKHQVILHGFIHTKQFSNVVNELTVKAVEASQSQAKLASLPKLLAGMQFVGLTSIEQDLKHITSLALQAEPKNRHQLQAMKGYLTDLIAKEPINAKPLRGMLSAIALTLAESSVAVKQLTFKINSQLTALPKLLSADGQVGLLPALIKLGENIDSLKKLAPNAHLDLTLLDPVVNKINQLNNKETLRIMSELYRMKLKSPNSVEHKAFIQQLFNTVSARSLQLEAKKVALSSPLTGNNHPLDLPNQLSANIRQKFNLHVAPGNRLISSRRPKDDAIEYADILQNLNVSVLISVAEKASGKLTTELDKRGIKHVNDSALHVPDFFNEGSLPNDLLEKIVDRIKFYENKGQNVAIHCGGGDGRSGLVKAAYVLSQLPAPLTKPALSSFIDTHYNHEDRITKASEAVSNAIIRVRAQGHEKALERPEDVKALEDYYARRG